MLSTKATGILKKHAYQSNRIVRKSLYSVRMQKSEKRIN